MKTEPDTVRDETRGRNRRVRWAAGGVLGGAIAWVVLAGPTLARPAQVPAVLAEMERVPGELRGQGYLEAETSVQVAAEVPGRVESVLVDAGDPVSAGDLLVRLDSLEAVTQLRAAEASWRSAAEAARSARHDFRSAQIRHSEAKADYERIAPLAGLAVPAADVESARIAVERTAADRDRAEALVGQLDAQVSVALEEVEAARRARSDLQVRAPIDGVVVDRLVTTGDVVTVGAPLIRLADPGSLQVVASFDESVLSLLRAGLEAHVTFYSDRSKEFSGRVLRVGREVDLETREVDVIVALDEVPAYWALGQRVDARVITDPGPPAILLSSDLVVWEDGAPGVMRLEGDRARWTPVTLGASRTPTLVEIRTGVAAGDTVVARGGARPRGRVQPLLEGHVPEGGGDR